MMLLPKETYWRNVGVNSVICTDRQVGKPTTEEERWGWILVEMAKGDVEYPCPDDAGACEVCQITRWWWEEKYNELPRYVQMAVTRTLVRHDIPMMIAPTVTVEE
jgi:hypothetical protein